MSKMKKWKHTFLSICLGSALILSGCQGQETESENNAENSTQVPGQESVSMPEPSQGEADGIIQIAWLREPEAMGGLPNAVLEGVQKRANETLEDYQIEFVLEVMPSSEEKWAALSKSYDMVYFNRTLKFTEVLQQTYFLDLTKELTEGALQPLYTSMPENYWKMQMQNGKIYNTVRSASAPVHGLQISETELANLDVIILKELVGQPMEAWDDFFAKIYEANGQKPFMRNPELAQGAGTNTPILVDFAWNAHFQMVGMHMGIAYEEPEKGVQCIYESEYAKKMLAMWDSYFEKGYVQAIPGGSGGSIRSIEMYGLTPYDVTGSGMMVYPMQSVSYNTNAPLKADMQFLVLKNSGDKELIFRFLTDMATDAELAKAICIDEEGTPVVQWTPRAASLTPSLDPAGINTALTGGEEIWQQMQESYEVIQDVPAVGFVFDLAPVQEQMKQITACNGASMNVVTGDAKADWESYKKNLDNFVAELHSAGIDEILAEANRQLRNDS